ncbi:Ferritin [Fasciola hepatica]|uniref:ferroxidase n=1 Tax=Fasciola hepatica TaxID=6192 RepID=A0A4E0RD35_FASHE|nr:Ferritin [Fasciola hepatica]
MQSSRTGSFPKESEDMINQLINLYWSAEQAYLTMSAACASDEISMLGFSEYFRLCCNRMRTEADKLCQFLITRGGHLVMGEVHSMIQTSSWNECTVDKFMHMALDMEKQFEQKLSEFYQLAKNLNDALTAEFIETNHVNGLKACDNAWMYDTMTMKPLVREICGLISCGELSNSFSGPFGTKPMTNVSRSTHGSGYLAGSECSRSFADCFLY